jgi:hypothetical protein
VVFLIEVGIAVFIDDNFIRPYFGDFLVVVLLYCAVRSVLQIPTAIAAFGVLIFSYIIETAQYVNFVAEFGLADSKIANVVLGNSFAWADIWAYTGGFLAVLVVEHFRGKPENGPKNNLMDF